jgi:hypothetical protein
MNIYSQLVLIGVYTATYMSVYKKLKNLIITSLINIYIIKISVTTNTMSVTEGTVFNMNAFRDAISIDPRTNVDRTFGENGHPVLTLDGVGDNIVALYYKIVRGESYDVLAPIIERCINEAKRNKNYEELSCLFRIVFQTRSTRGGKAEKLVSYMIFNILSKYYQPVMVDLVSLYPHYGYWKDLLLLLSEMKTNPMPGVNYILFKNKVFKLFADQLKKDHETFTNTTKGETPRIEGFCAKWAPSEGKEHDKQLNAVSEICMFLYPDLVGRIALQGKDKETISRNWRLAKRKYREMVTPLRAALEIPEVKMCANHWEEINIGRITSYCMNQKMLAIGNEQLKVPPSPEEEETGNRYPTNPDRIAARKNLEDHLIKKGISGKQLLPHELVKQVYRNDNLSRLVKLGKNAQWDKVVENLLEQIKSRATELQEKGIDINIDPKRMTVMSDVSGSMTGLPMMVSIAMGILISQITSEAFRDIVMTFETNPKWHKFAPGMTFVQKVNSLALADWGGNTNFEAGMDLIIDLVKSHNLTAEQAPSSIVVVSDMKFDAACGNSRDVPSWAIAYERIKCSWTAIGMKPPTIIFLNVHSGSVGFPAAADQEGTMLLSGWSPSVFKFILSGEMEKETEVIDDITGEVTMIKKEITPAEVVHKILTEDSLNPVQEIVNNHIEYLMKF